MVNHRSGPLRQLLRDAVPDGSDIVIDPVGGDLAEPALRSLRWGGRFVTVGYASGTIPRIPLNLVLLKGMHILGFQFGSFAEHVPDELHRNEQELTALLAAHRIRPYIGATFGLEDVAAAMRADRRWSGHRQGRTRGLRNMLRTVDVGEAMTAVTVDGFHPDLRRVARWLPRAAVSRRTLKPVRLLAGLQAKRPTKAIEVTAVGATSVRVHRPAPTEHPVPALLWIHGGGYVMGTAAQDDAVCRRFADELGIIVAAVDYRLAPEHRFPVPLHDCHDALGLVGRPAGRRSEPGRRRWGECRRWARSRIGLTGA